jgi:hypothetical protein
LKISKGIRGATHGKVLMGVKITLNNHLQQQGVCHIVTLPFTLKNILRQMELWKLKHFTMQKYNLQKILEKKQKSFKIL